MQSRSGNSRGLRGKIEELNASGMGMEWKGRKEGTESTEGEGEIEND